VTEREELARLQKAAGIPDLPTQLTYECRMAVSGKGPRAYDWEDKPHRLIYDLCREVERFSRPSPVEDRVTAPFRLRDRVKRKGQFGDATGSVLAMEQFDHGWECWVHVAAYGSNSIIRADDLLFVSHAPETAYDKAKGETQ